MRAGSSGLGAVVELRLRLALRRLRAPTGTAEGVARVVLFGLAGLLGLLFAGAVAAGSYRAARAGAGLGATVPITAVFFGVWQAWTALALVLAEREALDLRRFLGYPLPPRRVWLFGLGAGLAGDPFALFWLLLLAGAFAGAAAARPGPWLLPLGLDIALFAASTVALVALLQELVARLLRLRWSRELAMLAGVAGWLLFAAGARVPARDLFPLLRTVQWIFLPPALAAAAARSLYTGHALASLPWLAAQAAAAAAVGWVAWRLAWRGARSGEEPGAPRRRAAARRRPSRLPEALGPVFEKELLYLSRHPVPRMALLFLPAIAAVLAWRVIPRFPPEAAPVLRALPLFALSPLSWLMLQDLWVNAFGLDRGGARALLLSPAPPERLLGGKNRALGATATALFLLACAPYLAVGGWPPAWALAGAAALHLALAPVYLGLGNLVSVLNPSPAAFAYGRGRRVSALSALAGMVIFSAGSGLMAAPALLAIRFDSPWILAAGWALLGAAAWLAYRRTLPLAGALLLRRREQLLAAVCGDEA